MNHIEWLEQNITRIKEFVAEFQASLEQNPDSLAAKLAYTSTKVCLTDMEDHLREVRKNHANNVTTSFRFPFPKDFCGLHDLILRVGVEADIALDKSTQDTLFNIVHEFCRLQNGLNYLRYHRNNKSEKEIDSFLDLLSRGPAQAAPNTEVDHAS